MKNLFQEETSGNSKTPGQTAMKGLFAEQKEHGAKTPNQVCIQPIAYFTKSDLFFCQTCYVCFRLQ